MPAKRKTARRKTVKRKVSKAKPARKAKRKVVKKKTVKKKATAKKPAKKASRGVKETIIGVRVSPGFKRTFFAWCKKHGMSPTDCLREYMEACVKKK